MAPRSVAERVQARLAQAAMALPRRVAGRLAGPPIDMDGARLDPHVALSARARDLARRPALYELEIEAARREFRLLCSITELDPPSLPQVSQRHVDGPAGPLALRVYRGRGGSQPLPVVVFFHGGGFTIGDLDTHDVACRRLAKGLGCVVVAVDYRLAPEHPFPAAVEDALTAFRWVAENADAVGGDAHRVAVAGDSAGGTLAAVVCQQTRGEALRPRFGVLVYPLADRVERTRSRELFAEGFLLDQPTIDWFDACYTCGADLADPRLSVLRAPDLSGIPPQLVFTAGFDPLRDEGEAYARALRGAGVSVHMQRHPTLAHGWLTMSRIAGCRAAFDDLLQVVQDAFE